MDSLTYPLSFLLAILWYKPIQDGEQRVVPFALVTAFDLLALFIFLFQRQIGHWHDIFTSDIEQAHLRAESIDGASVTFVGQGSGQVEHRDFGARLDTPLGEIRRNQVMQDLDHDFNVVNRSRRDIGSSISMDTIRLNPRSVVGRSSGLAADGIGLDQGLDGGETSGRFAGAEAPMQGPSNVGWGTRIVQPVSEGQVGKESPADLELG